MKRLVLLASVCAVLALGADPAGFAVWKGTELKAARAGLSKKVSGENKTSSNALGTWGNQNAAISHREADGIGELHETVVDLFVIESGSATIIVGGKLVEPKTTGPGEVRSKGIEGGEKHVVVAGDVVRIPANTPHQMLLNKSKEVTYFVFKAEQK